jgi:hypothetical protein
MGDLIWRRREGVEDVAGGRSAQDREESMGKS